jgi:integrase
MELEDHDCWTVAEGAGHRGPHQLQHLRSSRRSGRPASCGTPFVFLLSDNGMAIEEISRLMGHSSNVTETVYSLQIRRVITVGAEAMDKIFADEH